MIDVLECLERCRCKGWPIAGELAEKDHAVLVGDRGQSIDDLPGGLLGEQLLEGRTGFVATQSSERARRRARDRPVVVAEQTKENGHDFRDAASTTAGSDPHNRIVVPQQRYQKLRRQGGIQLGGDGCRDNQCRALNHRTADHIGYGLCRLRTADSGEGAQGSLLLRHEAIRAEAGETSAKRRQGRYGRAQPTPRRLRSQCGTIGEACPRNRGNQGRVVHVGGIDLRSHAASRAGLRLHVDVGEKIELPFGHPAIMRGIRELSKPLDMPRPASRPEATGERIPYVA